MSLTLRSIQSISQAGNATNHLFYPTQSYSLDQNNDEPAFFVDMSVAGNRLVERNGTIQLAQENAVTLLARNVLKPTIDYAFNFGHKVFTTLTIGLSYLDRISTQAFTIFPAVNAQVLHGGDLAPQHLQPSITSNAPSIPSSNYAPSKARSKGWPNFGFEEYYDLHGLESEFVELRKNEYHHFSENYSRSKELKKEIVDFAEKNAALWSQASEELDRFYNYLFFLRSEIETLRKNIILRETGYAFPAKMKVSIIFPTCSVTKDPNNYHINVLVTPGMLFINNLNLLEGKKTTTTSYQERIKRAIISKILNDGEVKLNIMLTDFNKNNYKHGQFMSLFDKTTVDDMISFFEMEKPIVKQWISETFIFDDFCQDHDGVETVIKKMIDDIYKNHETTVLEANQNEKGLYSIIPLKNRNGLTLEWKIEETKMIKGFFYGQSASTSDIFKFSIRKTPPSNT